MSANHSITWPNRTWTLAGFVMLTTLLMVRPTCAGSSYYHYSASGAAKLTAVGDEPKASGAATIKESWVVGNGGGVISFDGRFALTCSGLTPRAEYVLVNSYGAVLVSGTADQRGTLQGSGFFGYQNPVGGELTVYRVEPTGNVLVLKGTIAWK